MTDDGGGGGGGGDGEEFYILEGISISESIVGGMLKSILT